MKKTALIICLCATAMVFAGCEDDKKKKDGETTKTIPKGLEENCPVCTNKCKLHSIPTTPGNHKCKSGHEWRSFY